MTRSQPAACACQSPPARDVAGDDRARRVRAHVHAPHLGAERREPLRQRRADEAAGARDEDAGHRASGRTSAPVSAARSAGASSISSPRRPAETKIVSCSSSALVQERRQALALPERADAARDVAGDLLGPRHVGHRGALADGLEVELIGRRDDRDREVVADAHHQRLEDAPRIEPQHFRRLARVGRRARVVVVLVQGVGDARGLGGAGGWGLAAGHRRADAIRGAQISSTWWPTTWTTVVSPRRCGAPRRRRRVAVEVQPRRRAQVVVAQAVEALVRAVVGLLVDAARRRVADQDVGGRQPAGQPRGLPLGVLERRAARVLHAALEAGERDAADASPRARCMLVVLAASRYRPSSWLP